MKPWERRAMHAAALAAAITGLCYGWFRYFGVREGEFGPEPHPLQATFQHLHVLFTPLLVLMFGIILRGHLQPKLKSRQKKGRWTGLAAALLFAPLLLAGYGIQTTAHPLLRQVLAWLHGLSGLLLILGYAAHVVRVRRTVHHPAPQPAPELSERPLPNLG